MRRWRTALLGLAGLGLLWALVVGSGTVNVGDDDGYGGTSGADQALGAAVTGNAVPCFLAREVVFSLSATSAVLCSLVTGEVSENGTSWRAMDASAGTDSTGVVLAHLATGRELNATPVVVKAQGWLSDGTTRHLGPINYHYCRLKVTLKAAGGVAATAFRIKAFTVYEAGMRDGIAYTYSD